MLTLSVFPIGGVNVLKTAKVKNNSQVDYKCYNLNQFIKVNRGVSTIIFQYRIQLAEQLTQPGLKLDLFILYNHNIGRHSWCDHSQKVLHLA